MPWLELHITTNLKHVDQINQQLTLFNVEAITLQDGGNEPIYEPSSTPEPWQETIVIALFDHQYPMNPILHYLEKLQQEGCIKHVESKKIADEDWVRRSLDSFQPMCFGKRLWVCPSWQTPPEPEAINICLDPGLAFGTGTHPTTALCLEWLDQHIQSESLVIDYGCGSGILGIAALKLGAKALIAVDHDPVALETTRQNGLQNNLKSPELITYFPNELPNHSADLLIANILAQPLIELAPLFATLTQPGGTILLSGILAENVQNMTDIYKPWYNMQQPVLKGEWVLLVGFRANNN